MRFMVMVKATKSSEAGVLPSEKLLTAMGKYNEELTKAGVMLAGEGLHPSSKGAASGSMESASNTCRISISDTSGIELGQRLTHSIASCSDAHFQSQKPATSSFISRMVQSGSDYKGIRKFCLTY